MPESGRYLVDELTPLTPASVIEALYWGFGAVMLVIAGACGLLYRWFRKSGWL